MATMKDVARLCGVAESTVSHVVNKTKFVAPATCAKIEAAMRELNFHSNAHARRLARGASDFLGLVISDIENPFFPGLIKAFETAALAGGFNVLLSTTNYKDDRLESAFRKMIENQTQGVAVMTSRVDLRFAQLLKQNNVVSVFLDAEGPGPLRSNIQIDYSVGASQAINYLYNLGHRKFGFVEGPQNRPSHVAYRVAVTSSLHRFGLKPQIVEGVNTVQSGESAVRRFLTQRQLPTAILCSNDLTAIGVIRELKHVGIQVPSDISVIGADDIPFSTLLQPALSTVRIPRERLGEIAFQLLEQMLQHGQLQDKQVTGTNSILETDLVIRESAGRLTENRETESDLRVTLPR